MLLPENERGKEARDVSEEPRALIVDWGGVLTNPMHEVLGRWMTDEDVDVDSFVAVMGAWHDEPGSPLHRLEVGDLTAEGFEEVFAAEVRTHSGSPLEPSGLIARMFAGLRPNHQLRRVVESARAAGWRTAVLSNSWGDSYDMHDVDRLVDVVLLSHRIGARKPDPEAYELAVRAVGVAPESCVFVDDLKRNIRGAEDLGMTAFLYAPGVEVDLARHLDHVGPAERGKG